MGSAPIERLARFLSPSRSHEMKRRNYLPLIILLALLGFCFHRAIAEEDLGATITYLLAYVKNSDVVFIRNNREHTPEEAAAHMRKKYEYFREEIKTPEDFIRLTSTKSLLSGKPYKIRLKNGKMMPSQKWLEDALAEYRKKGGPPSEITEVGGFHCDVLSMIEKEL